MEKEYIIKNSIDLGRLIEHPDYKWLDKYRDRLCFICVSGSWGYGTNIEGSDIDIRGVMLPTIKEIIGLENFEQALDEKTDTCIYSFNKFLKLASDCNPNVVELLGCDNYLIFNEVGQMLLDNKHIFLNQKCIHTFAGYATAQLRRIENALSSDEYPEEEKQKHLKQTIDIALMKLRGDNPAHDGIETRIEDDVVKLDLNINNIDLSKVRAALNDVLTIEHSYSRLNQRNKKKDEKALCKHILHLFRLHYTCFDILERGEIITNRKNERDFLMKIRNGLFLKDGQLVNGFYDELRLLEKRLEVAKNNTTIPVKPKFKELQELAIKVNKLVINNNVIKYNEPIKIVKE